MKNHFKVSVLGASGRMGSQIIKRVNETFMNLIHGIFYNLIQRFLHEFF